MTETYVSSICLFKKKKKRVHNSAHSRNPITGDCPSLQLPVPWECRFSGEPFCQLGFGLLPGFPQVSCSSCSGIGQGWWWTSSAAFWTNLRSSLFHTMGAQHSSFPWSGGNASFRVCSLPRICPNHISFSKETAVKMFYRFNHCQMFFEQNINFSPENMNFLL